MQTLVPSRERVVRRRRVLAVVELLVAGFLWFLAYDIMKDPYNPHMDLKGAAPFLILFGIAVAAAAVTAWLGLRRWKVWQAAALALPVVAIVGVMIRVNLF